MDVLYAPETKRMEDQTNIRLALLTRTLHVGKHLEWMVVSKTLDLRPSIQSGLGRELSGPECTII